MLGVAALLGSAAAASAGELLSSPLTIAGSTARTCSSGPLSGTGVKSRSVTAPTSGWVNARLDGGRGDWDLSVFDRATGRRVAGSSSFGADEVAQGLAVKGRRLLVQACRMKGSAGRAELSVDFQALGKAGKQTATLVNVATPTRKRENKLTSLDLDVTEHGGKGYIAVVLHGAKDAELLRRNGFAYTVAIQDLAKQDARDRAVTARYSRGVQASALPSGRTSYRQLSDYTDDMKKLVRENPGLVRPITLPFKTWEGRSVEGVEITPNVDNLADGKPIFMNMGVHHAREWPSGEHAMEWAFEMVNGYKRGDRRIKALVTSVRTVVIPIVNPDGFNISRTAGSTAPDGRGRPNPGEDNETANIASHPYEYRRKNCRLPEGEAGNCAQPALGVASLGVDPNRNYGTFWGGGGASSDPTNETYFGPGPFSEPETKNIKDFMSRRQVMVMITNHTFSGLVLRPPGLAAQGNPPDEAQMKALGDAMARENGYFSQHGFDLYDTTGTTEDWSYNSTGGYGYTFEIGCEVPDVPNQDCTEAHFHPPYASVVAEYEGTSKFSERLKGKAAAGNREAYFKAMEAALDARQHSRVSGKGPHGILLRIRKQFTTPTSADQNGDGKIDSFKDSLDTSYEIPSSDRVSFNINPSTRPLVSEDRGRRARGPVSPAFVSAGNAPPPAACPGWHEAPQTIVSQCYKDHPFTIAGAPFDNAFATVKVSWQTITSDYLLEIYRDTNGNGVVNPGEPKVDEADASGQSALEQITLGPDPPPGKYILRVGNFAAAEPYDINITFQSPTFVPKQVESWSMTCQTFGGKVLSTTPVFVKRGAATGAGLAACSSAVRRAFRTCTGADKPTGKVSGRLLDRARLGRDRNRHLRSYKLGRKGRRNLDRFCLSDKRLVSIGYPSARATKGFGRAYKRRLKNKAIFIITSSKRFKIKKVAVGARTSSKTTRRRLGKRRFRVGRNTWYLRTGKTARLIFKVTRGRVTAVGLGDKRLTATKKRAKRYLTSFK